MLLAAVLAIPAAFAQESPCAAPGRTVLEDAEGDWTGSVSDNTGTGFVGLPEHDILSLKLAQTPSGDGDLLLHFTLQVQPFTADPLPNAVWFVSFENPEGLKYGVRMQTDDAAAASYFSYLVAPGGLQGDGPSDGRFVTEGSEVPGEVGTGHAADGTITVIARGQNLGMFPPYPGQTLGPFNAATVQGFTVPGAVSGAFTMDQMPDNLARDGFFDLQDPANCKADAKSGSGFLLGGGFGLTLFLPLLGLAALRRTRRS